MTAGRRVAHLEAVQRRRLAPALLILDAEEIEAMPDDERQALREQVIAARDHPAAKLVCISDEGGPHPFELLEIAR